MTKMQINGEEVAIVQHRVLVREIMPTRDESGALWTQHEAAGELVYAADGRVFFRSSTTPLDVWQVI
jgi:hypothetical protein